MEKGFIKLHRIIQDNFLWNSDEPFSKRDAWIDLLLSANFKQTKMLIGGSEHTVNRGELVASVRFLCKRWYWNLGKVQRYLKLLERNGMITRKTIHRQTHITICKYEDYQRTERESDTPTIHSRYTNDTPTIHQRYTDDTNIIREESNKGIIKSLSTARTHEKEKFPDSQISDEEIIQNLEAEPAEEIPPGSAAPPQEPDRSKVVPGSPQWESMADSEKISEYQRRLLDYHSRDPDAVKMWMDQARYDESRAGPVTDRLSEMAGYHFTNWEYFRDPCRCLQKHLVNYLRREMQEVAKRERYQHRKLKFNNQSTQNHDKQIPIGRISERYAEDYANPTSGWD